MIILQKILFLLPPETAHRVALFFLKIIPACCFSKVHTQPIEALGLTFKNPIGLAAGFDKNGEYIDALGKLGFGFIEVGTVTPKPQIGNPKPRLFRLPQKKALINRMGFNNKGVDYLVEQLKKRKYSGIIGVNIGKNASTPIENATDDYLIGLEKVYAYADYITINISSPNTANLRQLQQGKALDNLLAKIDKARTELEKKYTRRKPILLKISPDETIETLKAIVNTVYKNHIDGIIATNTMLNKTAVKNIPHGTETGGLSGLPLLKCSTQVLKTLNRLSHANFPHSPLLLIGVGGITKASDVKEKLKAGAKLVQIYTGFIYEGPFIVKKLIKLLR
jgi:dihydroorotate dehydrogenase